MEQNLIKKIQLKLSPKTILFRNNVGFGWVGKSFMAQKPTPTTLQKGDVVIRAARPLHAGLSLGSSDTIGFTEITVTPEMVGKKIGVFTAIEMKTGKLQLTKEQLQFLNSVKNRGGIGGVARSVEDAELIIKNYKLPA